VFFGLLLPAASRTSKSWNGAEIDERPRQKKFSTAGWVVGIARHELPTVEVDMGFKIGAPRVATRALNVTTSTRFQPNFSRSWSRFFWVGKRIAEPAFFGPQEPGNEVPSLPPDRLEVGSGRVRLTARMLAPHGEGLMMSAVS